MDIVKKFEMMWPNVEQTSNLYGKNPQDKLGLYGNMSANQTKSTGYLSTTNLPPLQKKPSLGKNLQSKVNEMRNSRRNSITSDKDVGGE